MGKNIQKWHLVVNFGLYCELDVREDGIQDAIELFDYFAFDDDEGIVDVSSPKRWPVVCKNQCLKLLERRSHWRPSDLLVHGPLEVK
ncbi:unnamed protein product [Schistocephalus solidus]|uniref:DUF1493 family protein n=1 Tax=Schistocephalus solidus TaxID=70667 RepID=A0A183SCR1_SCHSO|nr:unnamed protein product [Schistocephalus solidus]